MSYGMLIDTRYCTGCQTCVVSCKTSNQVPDDAFWSHVKSLDGDTLYKVTGEFPNVKMKFRPTLCNHCGKPACIPSCPTGAISKDATTGVVSIDEEVCIGCGDCVAACPYEIPVLQTSEGVAGKCDFCAARVEEGELPYCVASCITRIRYFGDVNDPESEISQLIAQHDAQPYLPEEETGPSVYYIV